MKRRDLLVGAAGTVALASMPTVAVEHPDAALIAMGQEAALLIEEFRRHTRAFFALPSEHPDLQRTSDMATPSFDRLDGMITEAESLTATTHEGFVAKAIMLQHALRLECGNGVEFETGWSAASDFAWGLCCDLLAGSTAA